MNNLRQKRIGIIGFGEMGKRHGKDMEEYSHGDIEVVAVYEPDDVKYEQGRQWMSKRPARCETIEQLLESFQIDGVIIASPNFTHLDCLGKLKGKTMPVILEKPLDTTIEKVFEVVRFVENYEGPVMVHHVMRYAPIVKKAKELVDSGRIGKIRSFHFRQNGGGGMFHNFRRTMKTGGGQLLEKATHDFDVLLHLVGSAPSRVASICKQQYYGGNKPDDLRCSECDEKMTCSSYCAAGTTQRAFADVTAANDLCAYAKCVDIPDNETCILELDHGVFGTYSHYYFTKGYYYSRVYELMSDAGVMLINFTNADHPPFDGKIEVCTPSGNDVHYFEYWDRIHYNGGPGVVNHFYDLMAGVSNTPYSPVNQALAAEMIAFGAYAANRKGTFINIPSLMPVDIREIFQSAFKRE